jgi:phosphoribosylglycinamide formyltransferase-1
MPIVTWFSPEVDLSPTCRAPESWGSWLRGSGSNFEAIAQAIADGQLNAQVQVVVYNNPGAKVADRADRWRVPAVLLEPSGV